MDRIAKAIGVSETQLYRYLSGTSAPTMAPMIALCVAAAVSLDWLAGRDDAPDHPLEGRGLDDGAVSTRVLAAILEGLDSTIAATGESPSPAFRAGLAAAIYSNLAHISQPTTGGNP